MSNFSDFFPAASGGGGGGFTKQLKWTTARGLDDADYNNAASYTVNPATDLGLEDGAYIGVLLVGGGFGGASQTAGNTGLGGPIFYKNITLSNASTNLVLTIGIGYGVIPPHPRTIIPRTESTISGGLTLSSADGTQILGDSQYGETSVGRSGYLNGYGAAGNRSSGPYFPDANHGFGQGGVPYSISSSNTGTQGADGAILLFY